MVKREWMLKRNCSIAPHQLGQVFAILCAVSLTVAFIFTLRGAWYILVFSVLELSAVGFAFLIYARHATDREYIALVEDCLLVEFVRAGKTSRFRLDLHKIRIEPAESHRKLVRLESSGIRVDVGRYLTEWKRREFALELRQEIGGSSVR
ncbi:DUF2244 domain-containing protein [Herbaspirillum rhizosphaerae]|uniref:DUF2244 domain-containing protein n=1 Tax=Herbaspirillum rhizosphaerae TaxID=346179 RepID=UPI0012ECF7D7|nr:DUF2244 domain-containing protein [Herbaspirillum rhizosphaerae]